MTLKGARVYTIIGMVLGENWPTLRAYIHKFDLLIGAVLIAGAVWWVRRHLKSRTT